MAHRRLATVFAAFSRQLDESRDIAADAHGWSIAAPGARPLINARRLGSMTELALLRGFLAWETFLEESFILYLNGQRPPRGRAPRRFAFPTNYEMAAEWVVPEGMQYANWTVAGKVRQRAERFFVDGRPFAPVLQANINTLDDLRILRNAIAHASVSTTEKFEKLARDKLGSLPPGLIVGRFLGMTVPGSAPPVSFLESYLARLEFAARQIVPI